MPAIVVVGAGPAGCAAALSAARLPGAHVKVLEKRSLASLVGTASSPRAFPMVLSGRALKTLERLDLDLPSMREPYHGITFVPGGAEMRFSGAPPPFIFSTCRPQAAHAPPGAGHDESRPHRCVGCADPQRNRLVSRTQVALNLLQEVAQQENITVHFSAAPEAIDFDEQRVFLSGAAVMHDDSDAVLSSLPPALELGAHGSSAQHDSHAVEAEGSGRNMSGEMTMSTNSVSAWTTALALRAKGGQESEAPEHLPFDLLVAADGALSKVRAALPASHTALASAWHLSVKTCTYVRACHPRNVPYPCL